MPLKRKHLRRAVMLAATLVLLLALSWWIGDLRARGTDAEMRENLLQHTFSIAKTVNPELSKKLGFTAADKDTPAFEQLRTHFIMAGKMFPQRGVYSMILRDGKLFFGPENYPESDPMASPPGTVYKQPPPAFLQIFKDKSPVTVGPVTDEYGTFVSAAAPVLDPQNDEVLMVVGVDILASDWQSRLNAVRRGPLLTMIVLILLLSGGTIAIPWCNRNIKTNTLRFRVWIVASTALAMLGGLLLYGAYEYQEFDEESLHQMRRVTEQARDQWNRNIASEVQLLKARIDHIARDPGMLKAWQDRDLSTLTDLARPVHEQLDHEYRITHFYFIAPDRTIFLRAHRPDRRGDLIYHATLLAAERTGEDSWGVELGSLGGAFTLRYVRPLKQDGTTTGYLELGIEVEHLGRKLASDMNLDLLTVLWKEYTSREKFEVGRQAFGFIGQWDAYPDFVVAHQTTPVLPGEVVRWLEHEHNPAPEIGVFNARQGKKLLACGSIHLPDATGRSVADLVVMRDVTAEACLTQSAKFQNLSLAVVLFGGVLVLLWSVTGTAERQLNTAFTRLHESEKNYRRIVETANEGIWAMDGAYRTSYVNRRMADMLGYTPEEMIGRPVDSFMFTEDIQDHTARMEVRQKGGGGVYERRFHCKDGKEIWVIVSATVLKDAEEKFAGSFAMFTDITERKRVEESLRESEVRYRIVADNTYDWECWVSPDGKFLYSSPSCHRVTGHTAEDFLRRPNLMREIVHPEDLTSWDGHRCHAAGDQRAVEIEFRIIRADGQTRWVEHACQPVFDPSGKFLGSRAGNRDATERKFTELALQDSEERHRKIIEASSDAFLLRSKEIIIYANPAALKLFRANHPEDLIGKSYLDLVHPDDRALTVERVKRATDENWTAPPREHRILALDGQVVHVESIGGLVKQRGAPHIFGVFRDITERKRAEQEKEKIEGQLRQSQKMESIGTLAGGIAHDFNNILSVIIGHAEVLNFENDIGTSVRKSLDQILAASQRAKQLVRQILAFSRHGKQEKIFINLKPIVKESLEFLRASLPTLIELRHYLEPDAGTIMADPTQMQQVLMNLCVNASHAMEKDGGVLQIKLSNAAVTEEDTRLDPEVEPGDFVKLTVSDTGHGMESSVLQRIFDPYFTTKERGKGTGLGLSVVHGIVKSHGGMIKVDSEVGKGATFTIFLPRAKGFEKIADTPLQPLSRGTEKILFVDDENALADLGQQLLGELGYQVEARTSPIEALEAFRVSPQKFDLVITDLAMPQMTGLNLARKIMGIRPGMPIILCTGFSEQANEQAASAMGIRAFLLKPLVVRDIAAAVRKALDSKNA